MATLEPHGKLDRDDFARQTGLPESDFDLALDSALAENRIVKANSTYLTVEEVGRLSAKLLSILERFHAANPLRSGIPREELRNQLGLNADAFAGVLDRFTDEGIVGGGDTFVALPEHSAAFTPEIEAAVRSLLGQLSQSGLEVPPLRDVAANLGIEADVLEALEDDGRLVRVTPNIGYERGAFDNLIEQVKNLIEERGRIDVAGLRDHFGSSRKYCLALLEHLDSTGVTRRVGDDRVLRTRRSE
jgi:selenocysteine-specific elongation factor